jgi:purine-binding chemotaxis protein CheW
MLRKKVDVEAGRGGRILDVVVFRLGPQHFGIPVAHVGQVIPVSEIGPLPDAPPPVRGAVDVHGEVMPVIDLAYGTAQTWTTLHAEQQFILVEGPRRMVLLADEVEGVRPVPHGTYPDGLIYVEDVLT